ncbi:MAG: type II toxin-antitoxin system VapC family toxin [Pirellulales bacterium]|nr:type II toxin-antitoxin system VapC family toxin [Pirellulales bacterium]
MMMIWGVRGESTTGQEDLIHRAKTYIRFLSDKGHSILLPTPVIAEYLTPFNEENRQKQLKIIQESFRIAPFDLYAAFIAAGIQSRKDLLKGIQSDYGKSRTEIKTDCFIVAIAKACRVDKLISHDPGLRKLAEGHVTAIDIPEIHTQNNLPGIEE